MESKVVNQNTSRWLCGFVAVLLTTFNAAAQLRSPLVVGIVVEGLSDEYIEVLSPYFGEGGFKRLMNSAATLSHVDYGPGIDAAAATAIVYSGASPSVNGIPGAMIYDQSVGQPRHVLFDSSKIGNFTDETLSPSALSVSTLADELKINTDGSAIIFSIAPSSHQAIISAGHAGNGAFWLNDRTGAWATTTYYKEVPRVLTERNYRRPLSARLDTMKWEPLVVSGRYPHVAANDAGRRFRHTFSRKDPDRYYAYKATPLCNAEVTDLGIDFLTSMPMGSDSEPDMLNLTYNVSPAAEATPAEIMDTYLRLDNDLERLFNTIDRAAGRGNATVFLVGVPGVEAGLTDYKKWQIPTGQYSVRKAMSLLNIYLIAVHGNGDWVSGYYKRHFYLNRKLIKDRGLDLGDFRAEVADFLIRMSGVSGVYTIDDVIAARAGENPQATKRNMSVTYSGDVIIEVNPGWEIIDDGTSSHDSQQRYSAVDCPAFIMGPGITPVKINHSVDARAIAPTVARAIHIRSPNGAVLPRISM